MSNNKQSFLFSARRALPLLALAAALARADGILPVPRRLGDDEIQITGETFEADRKTGWVTVRKNVRVKTGDHELTADRVRLNRETGDVEADGHVVLRQAGFGAWTGGHIAYNYKTGKGLIGAGELAAGVFRVRADGVARRDDGRFDLDNLRVTTCTNAPGKWHWCIRGDGRYKDNDYVEIFHAVPYLFGVPFAWLPYWYRDLDTHYGFRMMPGYTSKWGAYLLCGYVFNIYESPGDAGPDLYGTTHLDLRSKRGAAVGQNVHWDLKEWGRGRFESYYARDLDAPDDREDRNWMSDVDDNRYRFRLFHTADLTPRDRFLLRGTVVSDSEMRGDFFEREDRGESIPMNFAAWEHRENAWAAGVEAGGPLNDFYAGAARLPEGWLSVMPQPLALGLNYESDTRAGYLDRRYARYDRALPPYRCYPGEWANFNTVRADTAHRLTYPMKLAGVLSLVPRAGYRGTYYSDAGAGADAERNVYRHSAEVGAELSLRAVSEWRNGRRHTFEPYLDYSYQPTRFTGGDGSGIYAFDRFDRSLGWLDQFGRDGVWLPYDWHGIRPGIRNVLQTRDEKGRVRTLADWDVFAAVQFDGGGPLDETGLRMIGARANASPTERIDVSTHGEWDTEEDKAAYVDIGAFYKVSEKFRFGGGYLARDHRIYDCGLSPVAEWNRAKQKLVYGGFTHILNDTWSWSCFVRYDARANELDEVGGYLQYQLDCLAFQLRTSYVNGYDRIDGTERDGDFRVSITMWLRAQQKEPDDEWLRW